MPSRVNKRTSLRALESKHTLRALAVTLIAVGLAAAARMVLWRYFGDRNPFSLFYPAVILTALYAGWAWGLVAAALATASCLFFWSDSHGFHIPRDDDWTRLGVFWTVDLIVIALGHRAHRAGSTATTALAEQRESESVISAMLDSLNEAFVLLDRDWKFLYVNRACEDYYQEKRENLLGRTLWEKFPHTLGTDVERQFRIAMEQRKPVEFETLSTRVNRWVASGAFPVAAGISIYVQDIDARKRAETALRESESRYRRLLETAQEGVWTIDANANTSYVNASMARMLGYHPDEMMGHPLFDFMDADGRAEAEQNLEKRHRGERDEHDFRFRKKDGSDFFGYLATNPIMGDNGEYLGALAMISDITGRRLAEREKAELLMREQKARAEAEAANRRKDQFLAVLSHELRTPLTPVLARLGLMKLEPDLGPAMRSGLEMIRRNVELEARLIDDLLDTTRLARGQLKLQLETIDAHVQLLAAVEIYEAEAAARKLLTTLDLKASSHHVKADSIRLQQIFWNLLGNAVKYTPPGGTLIIRSTNRRQGDVELLTVEFIDNGIGIDPEVMPRLFDPFEQGEQTLTRRYGGLGLGLSITRTLVTMHGGTVTATSAGKGLGSTFIVELPTIAAAVATMPLDTQPAAPPPLMPSAAVRRILLVDDNEDTLTVIAQTLRHGGHEVITANSVRTALAAAAQPFDLLISDIGLPDGTGWELMRELCSRGPVRAIALSGFSMNEDIRRSREAGFLEHLCKPVMPDELEQAIYRASLIKG
jgi:PAS domain S-box-containing protein